MPAPFRLSASAAHMQPSPIRELFRVIQQPGMISFAGGLPDPAAFPIDAFADCADVLRRDGPRVLQYSASEGYPPLREVLLERMSERFGRPVRPEELLVTSGSQQAVDLLGRALLDPGDVVVVEAPTYPGSLHCLRNAGARFAAVPADADGMVVEELPRVVAEVERGTGRTPKLIYTVPDFSNPSGACLALDRRRRLVELAGELGVPVLEDDPYGQLRYRGEPLPNLMRLAGGAPHVVYAGSFSKVLAPGVRVAWTVADPTLVRAMVMVRQGEDLCTSTVTQALVAEYCRRGLLERHLDHVIATYAGRCAAMGAALVRHLGPDVADWHEPEGGFFHWLRLARHDADAAFRRAVEAKVAFVPGPAFYPSAGEQVAAPVDGRRFARLCFTFATMDEIDEGCRRLATALEDGADG